jgi:hypothetical protein
MIPTQSTIARYVDLTPNERCLCSIIREVTFGRLENVPVRSGAVLLDPSPIRIHSFKPGTAVTATVPEPADGTRLPEHLVDLFSHLRGIEKATIRRIEIRHGLPILVEVESSVDEGCD